MLERKVADSMVLCCNSFALPPAAIMTRHAVPFHAAAFLGELDTFASALLGQMCPAWFLNTRCNVLQHGAHEAHAINDAP